jgi:hypothetical protein
MLQRGRYYTHNLGHVFPIITIFLGADEFTYLPMTAFTSFKKCQLSQCPGGVAQWPSHLPEE